VIAVEPCDGTGKWSSDDRRDRQRILTTGSDLLFTADVKGTSRL